MIPIEMARKMVNAFDRLDNCQAFIRLLKAEEKPRGVLYIPGRDGGAGVSIFPNRLIMLAAAEDHLRELTAECESLAENLTNRG